MTVNDRPRSALRRVAAAHDRHRDRHRPSGFGFALADSIRYVDAGRWDALTAGQSLFLQRRYLDVLEQAAFDNLEVRYGMIFRGRDPVAAVVMQLVTVSGTRVLKSGRLTDAGAPARKRDRLGRALAPALQRVAGSVRQRVLVCGNLLSWGFHAVSFRPGEDPADIWPAVAEALYRVRRADRLSGEADLVLVKDLSAAHADGAEALRRFSYRPVESDPTWSATCRPAGAATTIIWRA